MTRSRSISRTQTAVMVDMSHLPPRGASIAPPPCKIEVDTPGFSSRRFRSNDGRGFGNSGDGDRAAEHGKGDGQCESELFDPTLRVQQLAFRTPRWLSTSRLSQECLAPARDTRSRSIPSSQMRASRERCSSSTPGTLWPRRLVLGMVPSKVRML